MHNIKHHMYKSCSLQKLPNLKNNNSNVHEKIYENNDLKLTKNSTLDENEVNFLINKLM